MKLVKPALIKEIDKYAIEVLCIPATELMQRSGEAVANAIRTRLPRNAKIAILAGLATCVKYSILKKVLPIKNATKNIAVPRILNDK